MPKNLKIITFISLLSLVVFIGIGAGFVYSDARADNSYREDAISAQDRQAYQQANIEGKYGIHFQSHKDVCDVSTVAGEASCSARVVVDAGGKPQAGTSPSGYSPTKLLTAYGLTGLAPSGHPIIGIVDAYDDPNIQSDLSHYISQYGLPALPNCSGSIGSSSVACFQKVNQLGSTSSLPKADASWALEISLDVQTAHAMCQNCSVLLVEASSSSMTDLGTAVNRAVTMGAKVVSNSYGAKEFNGETAYDTYYNHPGTAIVVSSGDSGYGAQYPASSRYVTAAGGTTLLLNNNNTRSSETVWSGSGSGCSAYETKPTWQTGITDSLCTRRMVADVAADADPNTGVAVFDSYKTTGGGWFQVGGTSLSSPIISSVYVLSGNIPSATTESSLLYADWRTNSYTNLYDVTSGKNGNCSSSYLCTGKTGYDGPSGLGAPKGKNAF